jgi:acyl carrier protein
VTVDGSRRFFRYAEAAFVKRLLREIPDQQVMLKELGMDSLDVVEVVVEFEEALDATV